MVIEESISGSVVRLLGACQHARRFPYLLIGAVGWCFEIALNWRFRGSQSSVHFDGYSPTVRYLYYTVLYLDGQVMVREIRFVF